MFSDVLSPVTIIIKPELIYNWLVMFRPLDTFFKYVYIVHDSKY